MPAGRLLGMGWLFGTKGADKTKRDIGGIASATERVDDGLRSVNVSARMNKLGAFVESISLKRLGDISDGMDRIADAAGAPQITTNLEQTMLEMGKTTRTVAAGMGLTGRELREFQQRASSVAYALDADVQDIAEAMRFAAQTGVNVVEDMGMSWQDMGKAAQVYGVEAQQIVEINKSLRDTFDLGADGAKSLMDQTVAMAESFGFGDKSIQSMETALQAIDEQFAQTLAREGPEAVEKTMRGITGLGMVMTKVMGGKPAENISSAAELFRQLSGAQDQFRQLTAGLADDVPGFMDKMAQAGLNVDEMFSLMEKDPVEFALQMRQMTTRLEDMAAKGEIGAGTLDRFHGMMMDMPGPFRHLMEVSERLGPQLEQMLKAVVKPAEDAANAMRDLARRGFTTGRSLEEQLSRIRDRFETTFHRISRPEMRRFVRDMRKGYDRIGKKMMELASEGGPVGTTLKAFSALKQGGIGAAIGLLKGPESPVTAMDVLADQFIDLAGEAVPAATALGSMGLKFRHLGFPLMPLTKSLGLFNKALGGVPGKLFAILGPIGAVITAIGAFGGDIGGAFQKVGREIPRLVLKYVFGMENLDDISTGNLWKTLGNKMWAAFVKAFEWVSDNFGKGMMILWGGLKDALGWLWGKITNWWEDPSKSLVDKAKDVGKAIGIALGAGFLLSGTFRRKVFSSFRNVFGGILGRFRKGRAAVCAESQAMGQCMTAGVTGAPGRAATRVAGVPPAATRAALARGPSAGMGMEGFAPRRLSRIGRGMSKVTGSLRSMGRGLGNVARRAGGAVGSLGRMAGLGVGISAMGGAFNPLIKKLGTTEHGANVLGETVGGVMTGFAVGGPIGAAIGGAVGAVHSLYKAFTDNIHAAERFGATMQGVAAEIDKTAAEVIDWNVEARRNIDMMKLQEEQSGFLKNALYNLSPAYQEVVDAQKGFMAKQVVRERKQFTDEWLKSLREMAKQGQKSIKSSEDAVRKISEGFSLQAKQMMPEIEKVAGKLEKWRHSNAENAVEMRRKYATQLAEMTGKLRKDANLIARYVPEAFEKMDSRVMPFVQRYEQISTRALKNVTKAGEKAKDEQVGNSWGVEIAYGWREIARSASIAGVSAEKAAKTLARPAPGIEKSPLGKMAKEDRITVDTGGDGTKELIQVLTRGFESMVGAVSDLNNVMKTTTADKSRMVVRRVIGDELAGYG